MMRWWMGVLLLLNLATLAWQWDALAHWGWGPNTHREPERLENQLHPQTLKIEIPVAPLQAEASAAPSTEASAPPAPEADKVPPSARP